MNIGPSIEGFLRRLQTEQPVVAVVLDAFDIVAVAEHLKNIDLSPKPVWLLGSLGLELRNIKSWHQVFKQGIFVDPHMPELSEFKNYFLHALKVRLCNPDKKSIGKFKVPNSSLSRVTEEYMAENTGCVPKFSNGKGVSCNNIPTQEMELRFQQDPKARVCSQ